MRPLKLRLSGLRSWREEQELAFDGVDLAAVVGPTGAGKSSILEAIVYALYNTTTYEGNVKSLISSDAGTVSVAFDFEADGEVWRVTRSTSRTGYPPPVHKLVCLSGAHDTVEGRSAVSEAITALLGLNVDQFTSAVLLPQGRFQRLLTATDGERTAILKGVFRLDELDATRERALALRKSLSHELDDAVDEKGKLLPDPAAELAAARSEFDAADGEVDRLERVKARHDGEIERARVLAAKAAESRGAAAKLRTALAAIPSLDGALAAAASLAERASRVDRAAAVVERDAARGAVRAADAEGHTIAALSAAVQVLANAATARPRHAQRADDLARRRADLTAALAELARDREEHARVDLSPLVAERNRLVTEAAAARARLDGAREALGAARRAVAAEHDARASLVAAETAVADARAAAAEAATEARLAHGRLEAAETLLDATRRDHEAAHLAAGLVPGDECPVCHGLVPAGFTLGDPPAALSGAQAALATERRRHETAASAATAAAATLTAREAALETATTAHAAAVVAVGATLVAARGAQALPLDDTTARVLDRADADLLAPLADAAGEADAAARGAADVLATRSADVEAAARELARRADELEARVAPLEAAERALADERAALEQALDALPVRDAAIAEAALADVQRLHDELRAAEARLEAIDAELAAIREERAARVEAPRAAAVRAADKLAYLLEDAPERPDGDLAHDAAWLRALGQTAAAASVALTTAADDAERDARSAQDAAAAALGSFADAAALERALMDQRATRFAAERRIAKAQEDLPKVEALVARIAALRSRRDALDEVARLLNAGQFIGWLVQRRQRHLLTVASEILANMTGDRYRFAADFTVVDGRTGQPRSPRTLSGGESFLASLALALGMAELAARSGGRIGSLYLDEGFGSLDPNALDEAIEALETRARQGQMIMVISHVPTVAQRIERVLRVTPSPGGSSAQWLDDTDREALLTPASAGA